MLPCRVGTSGAPPGRGHCAAHAYNKPCTARSWAPPRTGCGPAGPAVGARRATPPVQWPLLTSCAQIGGGNGAATPGFRLWAGATGGTSLARRACAFVRVWGPCLACPGRVGACHLPLPLATHSSCVSGGREGEAVGWRLRSAGRGRASPHTRSQGFWFRATLGRVGRRQRQPCLHSTHTQQHAHSLTHTLFPLPFTTSDPLPRRRHPQSRRHLVLVRHLPQGGALLAVVLHHAVLVHRPAELEVQGPHPERDPDSAPRLLRAVAH